LLPLRFFPGVLVGLSCLSGSDLMHLTGVHWQPPRTLLTPLHHRTGPCVLRRSAPIVVCLFLFFCVQEGGSLTPLVSPMVLHKVPFRIILPPSTILRGSACFVHHMALTFDRGRT
jgi:hypothetical protein